VPASTKGSYELAESPPQVELNFTQHNVFGDGFEEEEVILDRYAALLAAQPQTTPEIELPPAIAKTVPKAIEAATKPSATPAVVRKQEAPKEVPTFNIVADAEAAFSSVIDTLQAEFNPADDPVMPEEPATLVQPPKDPQHVQAAKLAELPADDRDILVIEPDRRREDVDNFTTSRRRNYRQLFSSLRKR
jgi:hypothetical protein